MIKETSRVGITGSPGTGKKSIAKHVANLSGLRLLSINDCAMRLHAGHWIRGEFLVDPDRLIGKIDTRGSVTFGH